MGEHSGAQTKMAGTSDRLQFSIIDLLTLSIMIGLLTKPVASIAFGGEIIPAGIVTVLAAGIAWLVCCTNKPKAAERIAFAILTLVTLLPLCAIAHVRTLEHAYWATLCAFVCLGIVFSCGGSKIVRVAWICFGLAAIQVTVPIVLVLFFTRSCPGSNTGTAAAANCKAYAEAQEIYRRTDYDGDGVLEYSQAITGANSLVETKVGQGNVMLVSRTFGAADLTSGNATPMAGYVFKVLRSQGPNATGGQCSYLNENGDMTKGYALVACPGAYDSTGRDTFIINHNGTIFQKDLGPDTLNIVKQMTEFDPDSTWVPAE